MSVDNVRERFHLGSFPAAARETIIHLELALRKVLPTRYDDKMVVAEQVYGDDRKGSWDTYHQRYKAPLLGIGKKLVGLSKKGGPDFEAHARELLGHERGHALFDQLLSEGALPEIADEIANAIPGNLTGTQLVRGFTLPTDSMHRTPPFVYVDNAQLIAAKTYVAGELGKHAIETFAEVFAYAIENALVGRDGTNRITQAVERLVMDRLNLGLGSLADRLGAALRETPRSTAPDAGAPKERGWRRRFRGQSKTTDGSSGEKKQEETQTYDRATHGRWGTGAATTTDRSPSVRTAKSTLSIHDRITNAMGTATSSAPQTLIDDSIELLRETDQAVADYLSGTPDLATRFARAMISAPSYRSQVRRQTNETADAMEAAITIEQEGPRL